MNHIYKILCHLLNVFPVTSAMVLIEFQSFSVEVIGGQQLKEGDDYFKVINMKLITIIVSKFRITSNHHGDKMFHIFQNCCLFSFFFCILAGADLGPIWQRSRLLGARKQAPKKTFFCEKQTCICHKKTLIYIKVSLLQFSGSLSCN